MRDAPGNTEARYGVASAQRFRKRPGSTKAARGMDYEYPGLYL